MPIAVARAFRREDFRMIARKTLATKEASYSDDTAQKENVVESHRVSK